MTSDLVTPVAARTENWWKAAVVYQVYPRSFADRMATASATCPGITGRVDYLAGLGVDVIWLSPVYARQGRQRLRHQRLPGHRPSSDARRPRWCRRLHERGMKIVMDLVVNHTSDEHPWFVESRRSRTTAKRDWYRWRPRATGSTPGSPAPNRTTGRRRSPARRGSATTERRVLPALFTRSSPT